ncbi:hypothetical protein J6590_100341 [Homalodisca vitripennis]|nr:hypothetical protein J6590_100341 [Homalodisca vitripennis]
MQLDLNPHSGVHLIQHCSNSRRFPRDWQPDMRVYVAQNSCQFILITVSNFVKRLVYVMGRV